MSNVTFADIVSEELKFDSSEPSEQLILALIDNPWVQRLRDISQTGNTRLVYMFSEHSRFGHSIGVAYLASKLLKNLKSNYEVYVEEYINAVSAAALLHDIAHLAPGSHTAVKVWFPEQADLHEKTAGKIIKADQSINKLLESYETGLTDKIVAILNESSELPAWTWQILSGSSWNVDRGNWCIADSIMAGVSYGKYNVAALTDSIVINDKQELCLKENRLDAMLHFAVSRHAMYKQVYQHRVLLAADELTASIVKRCRDIAPTLFFADSTMQNILKAKTWNDLSIDDIYLMRESWWKYHLMQWTNSKDQILSDLSLRLLNRKLFKTVTIPRQENKLDFINKVKSSVTSSGFDPQYYMFEISSVDRFAEDSEQGIKVLRENGETCQLKDMDTIFQTILQHEKEIKKSWVVIPEEAKAALEL